MILDRLMCLMFGHVWVENAYTREVVCRQCDTRHVRRHT